MDAFLGVPQLSLLTGTTAATRQTVPYSTSVTINAALGSHAIIIATDGVAFTINKPINPVCDGQLLTLTVRNTTGGALGTVTLNAALKTSDAYSPGTNTEKTTTFRYDLAADVWRAVCRMTLDTPF